MWLDEEVAGDMAEVLSTTGRRGHGGGRGNGVRRRRRSAEASESVRGRVRTRAGRSVDKVPVVVALDPKHRYY